MMLLIGLSLKRSAWTTKPTWRSRPTRCSSQPMLVNLLFYLGFCEGSSASHVRSSSECSSKMGLPRNVHRMPVAAGWSTLQTSEEVKSYRWRILFVATSSSSPPHLSLAQCTCRCLLILQDMLHLCARARLQVLEAFRLTLLKLIPKALPPWKWQGSIDHELPKKPGFLESCSDSRAISICSPEASLAWRVCRATLMQTFGDKVRNSQFGG